ncbi:hypothetical protein EHS25_003649 [Saitozyma podzolica]|uniref:MPN domain-containing protein n=1 Tax=Saitozyma podzolica TaxID=1890683 RepID=A0A427Y7U5_9TREE|nr:hypothetical protein EHS25_003649 [Saitozyma podzolica]
MTSMAAALAASLPAPTQQRVATPQPAAPTKVPQRMEGVVDVEAAREVETVQLNSLVLLKIMKHSTDQLPPPPAATYQQDRNAPPPTNLSSHPDAVGVLLGLDLDGVMEVEDSFALPSGETSLGANSYSSNLLSHLRDVSTPDSPIGIYLSTHNGGFITRAAVDLLVAIERAAGRGKAILVIHDASRASGGDLSVKAYRLSEGARASAKSKKWDTAALVENHITPATLLTSIPVTVSSPSLINAFLTSLTTSPSASEQPSLTSPSVPLPPSFSALSDPLGQSLPAYLSDTLDALTLQSHEANNIAFLSRQIAREKVRHEQSIRDRDEENLRRRKGGLPELPAIPAEMRNGTKDPSRLELLCLQGQVDGLAKGMGAEAGKGLVRCYL